MIMKVTYKSYFFDPYCLVKGWASESSHNAHLLATVEGYRYELLTKMGQIQAFPEDVGFENREKTNSIPFGAVYAETAGNHISCCQKSSLGY